MGEPMKRCRGCAFTPGTEANRWPLILLQAELSVRALDSFYCHEKPLPSSGATGTLCAGFVQAMDVRHERGDFEDLSEDERTILREALREARSAEEILGLVDSGLYREAASCVRFIRRRLNRRLITLAAELTAHG